SAHWPGGQCLTNHLAARERCERAKLGKTCAGTCLSWIGRKDALMKAIVCTGYGPPEVLQFKEVKKPIPARNQVRIKIFATSVTASDCLVRGLKFRFRGRFLVRLMFGFKAPRRPILGLVLAGEIDALGRNVSAFKVGDPVFGLTQRAFGTYAQYVCWPANGILAGQPANLTFEEAAALP